MAESKGQAKGVKVAPSTTPMAPKRIADVIPFAHIAKTLERVTETKDGTAKKIGYINKLLNVSRQYFKDIHNGSLDSEKADGDSLYSIVRILLPKDDRGRKAYGFQAPVLGRIFADILALDKNSEDGKKLRFFRNPDKAGSSAGDFGTVVFDVMKSRFSGNTAEQTLSELHEVLDQLARNENVNQDTQKKVLQKFVRQLTPLEGKWLSRILLKSVQLGVNSNQIYKLLHSQAKDMQEKIWNLEKVCQRLNDPEVTVKIEDVTLFSHCGSMLCTRMTIVNDGFEADPYDEEEPPEKKSKTGKNKDPVTLPTPPFLVETKWDGERVHIHFDGSEFKYFSRRGFDFSKTFNDTLTPRLRPQINQAVQSFILDGEMMAWNKKSKTFTQKGGQIDVKRINMNNPNHVPAFVAFDIMFFNGEIVINEPQSKRSEMVSRILTPKEGVVVVPEQRLMTTKEQVLEALNEAIDNLEEGLIVKDLNTKYQPYKRPVQWLKIKPEYLDGSSVDDLDLLILGASYTDSIRKGGTISHFLIGIIDQSGSKEVFYPVARVGSGKLRNPEMNALVEELMPRCGKTEFSNVVYKGPKGKRPDLFINPNKSIVLQVKASEITFSDNYALNYTLRFPRIVKVRRDKKYNEIMSVEEFHRLRLSCGGKLAKRTDGKGFPFRKRKKSLSDDESSHEENDAGSKRLEFNDSDNDQPEPRPGSFLPRASKVSALNFNPSAISPLKENSTQKTSTANVKGVNIFKSKVFCVYGSAAWKSKMESDIKAYWGEIVQNPVKEHFYIVGEKSDNIKVEKAMKSGKYDVLKPAWLNRCIESKKEVEIVPSDFFQYTEKTGEQFLDKYDEFGDSYTDYLSLDDAKSLVSKVMSTISNDDESESISFNTNNLNNELFPEDDNQNINKYSFLKGVTIAFRCEIDPVLAAKIEFYGGKVVADETDEGVTHVINDNPLSPSKKNQLSAIIVKPQWLEDSIINRKVLDEYLYLI